MRGQDGFWAYFLTILPSSPQSNPGASAAKELGSKCGGDRRRHLWCWAIVDPWAAAAAILSPNTNRSHTAQHPLVWPRRILSNIPFPLQGHLSGRGPLLQRERREVPGILTQSNSVCSIRIQVHDTTVSNRANTGFQQMLVLIVHLLIQLSLSPSIYPVPPLPTPVPSHAVFSKHTPTHKQILPPLTMKLPALIQCAFSINPQVNKAKGPHGYLSLVICVDAVLSGFRSTTLALIHSTPDGITFAVGRPDEDNGLAPAPTRVQMGW